MDFLAVHCSATPEGKAFTAKDIDRWHREKGWRMIGYHYVIGLDGKVEKGRPDDMPGAHVEGYNSRSLGICLIGGCDAAMKPKNTFTPAQFKSLHDLLKTLHAKYPNAVIQGHRDFPKVAKACPSFSVKDWLKTNPV